MEVGFEGIELLEQDTEWEYLEEEKSKFKSLKVEFAKRIQQGIKLASAGKQSWLIFNGVILFWNNYLPVFRRLNFYEIIL